MHFIGIIEAFIGSLVGIVAYRFASPYLRMDRIKFIWKCYRMSPGEWRECEAGSRCYIVRWDGEEIGLVQAAKARYGGDFCSVSRTSRKGFWHVGIHELQPMFKEMLDIED